MKTKQKLIKPAVFFILLALFVSVSVTQFNVTARFGMSGADGYVKNSSNNNPISGAKVTLTVIGTTPSIDYTDSNGYYFVLLKMLLLGPVSGTLKVEKSGFITSYESITIYPGETTRRNVFLDPPPPPPTPRSVTYAGTVLDNYHDYVSQATVKLEENGNIVSTTTADTEGNYAINYDIWPDRDYDLIASKTGYETVEVDVPIIEEGETHYESFYMTNFPQKYAVIACITDYQNPSHAFKNPFGWKDSNGWYHRFTDSYENGGYNYDPANVIVLTDVANENLYDGNLANNYAVESTIKTYLNLFVDKADPNDIISFIFSGCAYSIMDGGTEVNTYLCTYEYHEDAGGYLYDYELAEIFEDSRAYTNFIFLDVSHAGGFVNEIEAMTSYSNTYFAGACDTLGQKYWEYDDYWETGDGSLWTYWFLEAPYFIGGYPPYGAVIDIHNIFIDGKSLWFNYVSNNLLGVYPPITVGYVPYEDKPIFRNGSGSELYLDIDWWYY